MWPEKRKKFAKSCDFCDYLLKIQEKKFLWVLGATFSTFFP